MQALGLDALLGRCELPVDPEVRRMRRTSQATTSRIRVALSVMRQLRHWLARTDGSRHGDVQPAAVFGRRTPLEPCRTAWSFSRLKALVEAGRSVWFILSTTTTTTSASG